MKKKIQKRDNLNRTQNNRERTEQQAKAGRESFSNQTPETKTLLLSMSACLWWLCSNCWGQ